MITFPNQEDIDTRGINQIFKKSKKSLCRSCIHYKTECDANKLSMACSTDSKIGAAMVDKCTGYTKDNQ